MLVAMPAQYAAIGLSLIKIKASKCSVWDKINDKNQLYSLLYSWFYMGAAGYFLTIVDLPAYIADKCIERIAFADVEFFAQTGARCVYAREVVSQRKGDLLIAHV